MMRVEYDREARWGDQHLDLLLCVVDLTEEEELLSRRMMKYWANFARNG
jgi:hypothetical protein